MKKQLQNILTFAFVLFLATGMAYAQQGRVHAALMGGVASYGGDNDKYSGDMNLGKAYFDNAGPNLGLELGYGLTDQLTALLRGAWGKYPNIESRFAANTQKDGRLTGALLLRYQIFSALANKAVSPYVQLGANLTQASKQAAFVMPAGSSKPGIGYGPSLGLGVQFKVGPVKLGIDGTSYMVTPDAAVDAADPEVPADERNFDFLNFLSANLSFDLKEGVVCNPALVTNVNLPSGSVNMGQATNFSMGVAPTATVPVAYMWDFGDGNTGTGAAVTHTYARPGTYTVTSSAMNCRGTDTKTGTVTVVDPCGSNPAKLSAANAPTTLETGKSGSFTSSATGSCQVSYAWDFGNGATASTANASYSFSTPGTYTVKVTAKNAAGSDSRTFRVTVNAPNVPTPPPVTDPCSKVTELNSVYFNYGASTIDAQAMSLIDENITALKDCPNLKIVVTGYSDSVENSMTIAQRRAKAIADYMTSKGIDASRITVRGAGVDPNNCDKEDPGRGCRRNRRVEAVIVR